VTNLLVLVSAPRAGCISSCNPWQLKKTPLHMFETSGSSVISRRKGILNHNDVKTSNSQSRGPDTSLLHNVAKFRLRHLRLSERYCRKLVVMQGAKCTRESRGWRKCGRNGYRRKTKIRPPVLNLEFTTPKGPCIDFRGMGENNYNFFHQRLTEV